MSRVSTKAVGAALLVTTAPPGVVSCRACVAACAVYPTDRVPHMNDVEAWDRVCFGRPADADLQLPTPLTDDSAEMTQLSHNICSKIMALEQVGPRRQGGGGGHVAATCTVGEPRLQGLCQSKTALGV